ncbi:MAG: tetratricopeptide repeat protein [Micropepsaceae bacterium]
MKRLLIGAGAALLAAAVVVGVVFFSPNSGPAKPVVGPTEASALDDPFGELRDRKNVGEQHYMMGRYPEAIQYWTDAAAKGDAYAAHRLGVEYMDGKPGVVQRDYAKARAYHLQAAKQGYSLSMFDLGSMNEFGYGVDKNLVEAAKWYGHSAQYGLAQGQYNFATMLESGDGVNKDEIEALKYYLLAARGGFAGVPFNSRNNSIDQSQSTPAEVLRGRLSKEQSDEARKRADQFVATTGPLSAE